MSWSSGSKVKVSQLEDVEWSPSREEVCQIEEGLEKENGEQFDAAVAAVAALAKAVGAPFHVSIGGHANPGHAPSPRRADECISVSISVESAGTSQ